MVNRKRKKNKCLNFKKGKDIIKKSMKSIEEISKIIKIKIIDMNYEIEDPDEIQSLVDEKI